MSEKLERMAFLKAKTGKASKSWLKSAAASDLPAAAEGVLDAAFPGWRPRRGIDRNTLAFVDDIALAFDLSPTGVLEPRLQEVMDSWVKQAVEGTLSETLWRYLDNAFPSWLGKSSNKRIEALRLRAVQLAGFRAGAGREPHVAAQDKYERSLAGWLRRNRSKKRKGVLPARDEAIILGRMGSWAV